MRRGGRGGKRFPGPRWRGRQVATDEESGESTEPAPPEDPEKARKRAFNVACRALARRPLTRAELMGRLEAREFDREVIADTMARIDSYGYLDEAAVADAVVRDAQRRHRGSRKVALTLRRRQSPAEHIARAIEASGEHDRASARELLERRFPDGIADARDRARALRLLLSRGYPNDVAREAVGMDFRFDDPDG